jgi:hypothetical protein
MYNFVPNLHLTTLKEIIEMQSNDSSERAIPLVLMAENTDLNGI